MNQNENIQEELLTISEVVANIPKCNVFEVPEGYFDHAQSEVLIKCIESPVFETPENYFDQLPEIILDKIKNTDSPKEENLILSTSIKQNPYEIPSAYFETLPDNILQAVKEPAKVISISKNHIWIKLVAAVIVGLIGFAIIINLPKKQDEEISLIEKEAKKIILNKSFESEFEQINDKEIENYLEENGHDVNAALVASLNEDEISLDNEDILYDEEAVDNYLTDLKTAPKLN
ncbi:MAG: hypothetical protein NT127_06115 [Sphingobacteriales bacterium]|nr:hypothetical protein [Sphingobacteriales bacterium]